MARYLRPVNIFTFFLISSIVYALFIFYLSAQSDVSSHLGFIKKQYLLDILSFLEGSGLGISKEISYFAYNNQDKAMHFILYTGFGILLYLTMHFSRNAQLRRYAVLLALVIGVSYAITDEIHQSFVPGRTSSQADVIADTAGLVFSLIITPCFVAMVRLINKWFRRGHAQ
ncbi:MAG: VanZ family protein [ANME-2 cluster archaeon]|nr:VanZ family protein [ANME-2 cluster archaeon]